MKKQHKILVVDNEPDILELLEYNLQKEGYVVQTATNGREAIKEYKKFLPELIILDIMMAEMDGIEACRGIVEIAKVKPYIIFLTARHEEFIELAAFDAGANDYVVKPLKIRALIKRINMVFEERKTQKVIPIEKNKFNGSNIIKVRDIIINKDSFTVIKDSQKILLPKKEFEILCLLSENTNKVFSRTDILQRVWGIGASVTGRTVDVHIRKIRERIGDECINTIVGIGYIIET